MFPGLLEEGPMSSVFPLTFVRTARKVLAMVLFGPAAELGGGRPRQSMLGASAISEKYRAQILPYSA
jgi:hypothetical protein